MNTFKTYAHSTLVQVCVNVYAPWVHNDNLEMSFCKQLNGLLAIYGFITSKLNQFRVQLANFQGFEPI